MGDKRWGLELPFTRGKEREPLEKPMLFGEYQVGEFMAAWKENKNAALFIDESGKMIGVNRRTPLEDTATMARHWGHVSTFIAQRARQVSPNVRNQTTTMVMFNQTKTDAKLLYDEWGYEEILEAPRLGVGEFFYMGRIDEPPKFGRVDVRSGRIYLEPDRTETARVSDGRGRPRTTDAAKPKEGAKAEGNA